MRLLVFVTPKDFRDETVSILKVFFNKWGVDYKIGSYSSSDCVGYHGAVYKPEVNANKISTLDFDGIVLVDGKGIESYRIYEYRPLLDLVTKFNDTRKPVIALGNATKILARANIINGKRISIPKDDEIRRLVILFHGIPSDEKVELADNLVTAGDTTELEGHMNKILSHLGVS